MSSVFSRPWSDAWGKVGLALVTSAHNGISSSTDVTGMTATWTAVSGRLYKVTTSVIVLQNTSSAIADIRISDSSNNTIQQSSIQQGVSGYATHTPAVTISGLSGSVTYKMRAATTAGTINIQMAATTPGLFLVEDIGPA